MKKKNVYDIAKCITVFLVVLAHVTRMYTGLGIVTPVRKSLLLKHVTEYIYAFHMPLFILLSGCIFGCCIEEGKYQNIPVFIIKKFKRLVIPYFIFGLCYVTPVMYFLHFTKLGFWDYFVEGIILSKNARHLWFVLALFWIFILAILLRKMLLKERTFFVVLCASFLLYAFSEKIPPVFQWRAAASYQIFFFLGVCINKYFTEIFGIFQKKWYAAIPFGAEIFLRFTEQGKNFYLPFAVAGIMMLMGSSTYLAGKNVMHFSIVKKVNENGYGIYFFHPMIIYVLFAVTYQKDIPPIVLSVAVFLISFGISYVFTVFVKKLRLDFIIGENKKK